MFLYLPLFSFSLIDNMLILTNTYRLKSHLNPLSIHPGLQRSAQSHADYLCSINRLTHSEPFQKTLSDRLLHFDYVGEKIGENLAREEGSDYEEVFRIWKNSKEHERNLLGDYSDIGIGTCKEKERYWVMIFGKKRLNDKVIIVLNENDNGDMNQKSSRCNNDSKGKNKANQKICLSDLVNKCRNQELNDCNLESLIDGSVISKEPNQSLEIDINQPTSQIISSSDSVSCLPVTNIGDISSLILSSSTDSNKSNNETQTSVVYGKSSQSTTTPETSISPSVSITDTSLEPPEGPKTETMGIDKSINPNITSLIDEGLSKLRIALLKTLLPNDNKDQTNDVNYPISNKENGNEHDKENKKDNIYKHEGKDDHHAESNRDCIGSRMAELIDNCKSKDKNNNKNKNQDDSKGNSGNIDKNGNDLSSENSVSNDKNNGNNDKNNGNNDKLLKVITYQIN